MKRILFIILGVVAVFLVFGITFTWLMGPKVGQTFSTISNQLPGEAPAFGYGGGAPSEIGGPASEAPMPASDASRNAVAEDAYLTGQAAQERLVIENADLSIVVKDPKARMKEISDLAQKLGGFVVSSNMYQNISSSGQQVPQGSIVIRVPSEKLDEALSKIKEGAIDVPTENRSGQDVTSQYVDLQAQLTAKQAAEKKLLEIMDQATRAADVLAVYTQVQTVQTEIEQLKGQIKYLEESAAMSAISVQLIAEESTQPIVVGPWKPEGAAKEAIQDLIYFFQNFVDFLIRLVLLTLPALILIAIPLFLVYLAGRAVYRRVRKSRVVVDEGKSEEVKK
jgi:uncharacterized protein DUF4349